MPRAEARGGSMTRESLMVTLLLIRWLKVCPSRLPRGRRPPHGTPGRSHQCRQIDQAEGERHAQDADSYSFSSKGGRPTPVCRGRFVTPAQDLIED